LSERRETRAEVSKRVFSLDSRCFHSHGRDNIIHFHTPLGLPSTPSQITQSHTATHSASRTVATINGYRNLINPPRIIRSLPVNSLNFCGFHLIPIPTGHELEIPAVEILDSEAEAGADGKEDGGEKLVEDRSVQRWKKAQGLLAVPNLTDSETVRRIPVHTYSSLTNILISDRYLPPSVLWPSTRCRQQPRESCGTSTARGQTPNW
jgi:hypothetical protein